MTSSPQALALKDIHTWIGFIRNVEIPVLKHTAREIARLREDEDNLSARAISSERKI